MSATNASINQANRSLPQPVYTSSVPGVSAVPPRINTNFFPGVPSQAAGVGFTPNVGILNTRTKGVRHSEEVQTHTFATAVTGSPYDLLYNRGNYLFCMRAEQRKKDLFNIKTNYVLNDIMRTKYEVVRRAGGLDPEDRDQAENSVAEFLELGEDFILGDENTRAMLEGQSSSRSMAINQIRDIIYMSDEGIADMWSYIGVLQNDDRVQKKHSTMLNVASQGPMLCDNIWQKVEKRGPAMCLSSKELKAGDRCSFIFRRRRNVSSGQYEQFIVEPWSSSSSPVPEPYETYYEDDRGIEHHGHVHLVGDVVDTNGKMPDPVNMHKMTGVDIGPNEAYTASGSTKAKVKLALGTSVVNRARG